ncbi:D-2-hydroxyacid dehydrogenase [Deltaproteobacteria bacterium]|nr:D-2-hydroxyacid dehydrogenase [Deltaproteobacteria bacterium]
MYVLILNAEHDAHEFKSHVASDFPDINFLAAREEDEVGDFIEKAEILVTLRISDSLLSRAKNVKWIQSTITGTDYIEGLPSFRRRKDIILTSSRGIHGPQMSEMAIMFMIAMNRQFPRSIRNQDRRIWERWPTAMLFRKKVGILGVGAIGRSIAKKCKAFEMNVLGIGPHPKEIDEVDEFYTLDELHHVMAEVDYFICVAPSKPENRKMLNAEAFSKMKPAAFFINIGRGEVVDEDALVQALKERKIAGAALDTFCQEPLPGDHPFWGMDNVIITPHVGGMSDIYVQQAANVFIENLKLFMKGEKENLINLVPRR